MFIVNITISNFHCSGTVQQYELRYGVNSAGLVVEILTLLGIEEATTAILLYKYRTLITNTVYWSNVSFYTISNLDPNNHFRAKYYLNRDFSVYFN